jgi:23S rRNA (pseudouridine1915-N3)-methyltransferase
LLSKDGKQVSTEQFASLCAPWKQVTFVIWWPYGLDEQALDKYIESKIAFGQQTMPHGLAKLVLAEQIYRSYMLQSGRSYHY